MQSVLDQLPKLNNPEIRKRLLFTLVMLAICRLGEWVPLPGVNHDQIYLRFASDQKSSLSNIIDKLSIFSGGNLGQSMLFGLGIMPYISASIVLQLLSTSYPYFEKLQKEGEAGRRKILEYTRYATVVFCIIQSFVWLNFIQSDETNPLVFDSWRNEFYFWISGVLGLTAGTLFLVWLGDQIDEYGIGNGISLIIMVGIVARMPVAVRDMVGGFYPSRFIGNPANNEYGFLEFFMVVSFFLFIVLSSVLISQSQRRIAMQYAKRLKGNKMMAQQHQRQYLPLRLNQAGVMPIIFASTLMIFPSLISEYLLKNAANTKLLVFIYNELQIGGFLYIFLEAFLIFFFSYFWTQLQFRPQDVANQIQEQGAFIPGIRPGKRTSDYLEKVMEKLTFLGSIFLCIVALLPVLVNQKLHIKHSISNFLGGTGLLIVVSVALDSIQRLYASSFAYSYTTKQKLAK